MPASVTSEQSPEGAKRSPEGADPGREGGEAAKRPPERADPGREGGKRLLDAAKGKTTSRATPSPPPEEFEGTGPLAWLRFADLGLLALALPIFLAAGLPLLGWGAAAVAWIAQRIIRDVLNKRAAASKDPRTVAGLLTASMIGRGWLIALTIFGSGLVERKAGLSAAVLVIALFTLYFTVNMVLRPFERR
jgi:hypothetical protein